MAKVLWQMKLSLIDYHYDCLKTLLSSTQRANIENYFFVYSHELISWEPKKI